VTVGSCDRLLLETRPTSERDTATLTGEVARETPPSIASATSFVVALSASVGDDGTIVDVGAVTTSGDASTDGVTVGSCDRLLGATRPTSERDAATLTGEAVRDAVLPPTVATGLSAVTASVGRDTPSVAGFWETAGNANTAGVTVGSCDRLRGETRPISERDAATLTGEIVRAGAVGALVG